ncbi:MAG: hypothetical protein II121_06385 [Fibrobacter sp.]|nr:hypothetical protein [Fibrobacter sp.]
MKLAFFALASILLVACSDDESFSPASGSKEESSSLYLQFKDRPCNSSREGREVVVGKNKRYTCVYDDNQWAYLWESDDDTLTAEGKKFRQSSSSYYSSTNYSNSRSSSSISSYTSKSSMLRYKGEQFNPDINYGTLNDSRDGKSYRTVRVGDQVWMAENLNFDRVREGATLCVNEDEEMCDLYGRLYTRDAAFDAPDCAYGSYCSLSTPIRGICPSGWHIPTTAEVQTMLSYTGNVARTIMSESGWAASITPGTNDYGLSFVGLSNYTDSEVFSHFGTHEYMWHYDQGTTQSYIVVQAGRNEVDFLTFNNKELMCPVRCIKD